MASCQTCRFFFPEEEGGEGKTEVLQDGEVVEEVEEVEGAVGGTCHEDSPKAVQRGQFLEEDNIDNEVVWPWVAADDWCGKWRGMK